MKLRILAYETVTSTNDLALDLAHEGASEGLVVAAEFQRRGRGRFKRRWTSPRGKGLLFSLILRPEVTSSSAAIVTHEASAAVAAMLRRNYRLPAKLKRPNDVIVHGRKIAGILTEASAKGKGIEHVIVGIGINTTAKRGELSRGGTSIREEGGTEIEKTRDISDILIYFTNEYRKLSAHGCKPG